MLLTQFVSMTQLMVQRDGFDDFLPVAVFPERQEVRVLEGAPTDADPEGTALGWAEGLAKPGEEYLVAFKVGLRHFKAVRRGEGAKESGVFEITDG
jgi:hypothetical protein